MIEKMLLQILVILSTGDFLAILYYRNLDNKQKQTDVHVERFILSIIFGYASFIIPMVLVGMLLTGKLHFVV